MKANVGKFNMATLLLVALLVGWVVAVGRGAGGTQDARQPAQASDDRLHQLLKSRYDSAARLFEIEETLSNGGRATLADVCDAARRVRDAAMDLSTTRDERRAAHERYLAVTRRLEEQVNKVAERGHASPADKELARFLRLDAEVALLKATLPAPAAR